MYSLLHDEDGLYWAIKKAVNAGNIKKAANVKAIKEVVNAKAIIKADYVGPSKRWSMLGPV